MNLRELLCETKDMKTADRVARVEKYLNNGATKDEKELLNGFYDASKKALKRNRSVTRAGNDLFNHGFFLWGSGGYCSYAFMHQISCISAGEEIRTPQEEMKENNISIKCLISKSYERDKFGIRGYNFIGRDRHKRR